MCRARLDLQYGLTLVELLVAMALTAVLMLGIVQLVSAAGSATLLQDNQAAVQDRIRYTQELLFKTASEAGFAPIPWDAGTALPALAPGTADGVSAHSDRLVLQAWSDLNCFDNRNPDLDTLGKPRFFIRESSFDLNGSSHLTRTCRYGASHGEMVTQVNRQGLVPGIESFQLLFGEDSDGDGNVDRWINAGEWTDESRIMGIRAGLLIAGPDAVRETAVRTYELLDAAPRTRRDGKLREPIEFALPIRGRVR